MFPSRMPSVLVIFAIFYGKAIDYMNTSKFAVRVMRDTSMRRRPAYFRQANLLQSIKIVMSLTFTIVCSSQVSPWHGREEERTVASAGLKLENPAIQTDEN